MCCSCDDHHNPLVDNCDAANMEDQHLVDCGILRRFHVIGANLPICYPISICAWRICACRNVSIPDGSDDCMALCACEEIQL